MKMISAFYQLNQDNMKMNIGALASFSLTMSRKPNFPFAHPIIICTKVVYEMNCILLL